MLLLPGLCPPGVGGRTRANVSAERWVILFLLEEVKEDFLGEVSLELHFVIRYAGRGIFQVEETAEAGVEGAIMEERVLLVFGRPEGLRSAHPLY